MKTIAIVVLWIFIICVVWPEHVATAVTAISGAF